MEKSRHQYQSVGGEACGLRVLGTHHFLDGLFLFPLLLSCNAKYFSSPPHAGWAELIELVHAGSQTQKFPRSRKHLGPEGEFSSQPQERVESTAISLCAAACSGREFLPGVTGGSDAALQIMLCAAPSYPVLSYQPQEECCLPRSNWLNHSLSPTLGFMELPLSGVSGRDLWACLSARNGLPEAVHCCCGGTTMETKSHGFSQARITQLLY